MIEVGESTGAPAADAKLRRGVLRGGRANNLTAAMSLIEPLILIVMGGVVVTILIALYLRSSV